MNGGGHGPSAPGHARSPSSASGPSPTTSHSTRPRKFVIQSTFGNPRERRSRKNRPCDACRRRKTACVITSEPPCLFCQSRGIVCQSTPTAGTTPQPPPSLPLSVAMTGERIPPSVTLSHQGSPASHAETAEPLPTPSTTEPSPKATSPFGLGAVPDHGPRHVASAAAVHHGLVYHASPSNELAETPRPTDAASPPLDSPETSAPVHSLEDLSNWTAYYMGPSAEQDAFLLDAFRYGILSERYNVDANIVQVRPGCALADDRPMHFLFLEVGHPEHTNRARQAASDAIEAKVWPYGENLVRLYFRHVHPVSPIVSKVRFLRRYQDDKKSVPASLRGAIYALASVFWRTDPSLRGTACPFQQHELVNHAHSALRREIENPNLFVVQACLLLMHVTPPPIDCMEAPTTWTFATQATACAQIIGLHQEPGRWHIEPLEKRLRRKLWWAIFVTDCWSSVCHGNPPHISMTSFDTLPLTMCDMRADEDVPVTLRHLVDPLDYYHDVSSGARFIETVAIARHLRAILDCSYQVNTRAMTMADKMNAQVELAAVQAKLREWPSLLSSCLVIQREESRKSSATSHNCPLYLSYYAAQVLLYRSLMHPATRAAKATPGSNLRKWFDTALAEFESFAEFLACVTFHDLHGFWGRHSRSQLILCGNFLIYLFLLASERRDIERAYRLLESFHQTVHDLGDTDQAQAKSLLRAATLRIDSFFTQAAQIMRHGGDGSAQIPDLIP